MDDPYTYGQIAAANSLSDVYAMGGKPILAMNIVCFPSCLKPEVLSEILKGGQDKVNEAGALLVGGHSVDDKEPKYGLSVSGLVSNDKVLKNNSIKKGDILVITKPIGLGVMNTAIKADLVDESEYKESIEVMSTLNKYAIEALKDIDISACTDITGFGLLGHLMEMLNGNEFSLKIDSKKVPIIKGSKKYAEMGIIPAGMYGNREYIKDNVKEISEDQALLDLMYDPQTSGGLLLSINKKYESEVINLLSKNNKTSFAIIGEVTDKMEKDILVY